jgi:multiple sugar transport system permease protein
MADGATIPLQGVEGGSGASLKRFARRRSTIAFLMALPLIAVIGGLVAWPAGYAIYLSTLNRRMTSFIGLGNFEILLDSETFRMVIFQSVFFAVTAVILKALIGFWLAHMLHHLPAKGQRKWRGMLLVPWVIPPRSRRSAGGGCSSRATRPSTGS